jgi:hypothetical protein
MTTIAYKSLFIQTVEIRSINAYKVAKDNDCRADLGAKGREITHSEGCVQCV